MITIEEKARDYVGCIRVPDFCESCYSNSGVPISCSIRQQYDAFLSGYTKGFEWTSIDIELPDSDRAILAKNEENGLVWVSNFVEGRIIPYSDPFFGVLKATCWREIEIELKL
jgi:hypothetical protein